MPTRYRLVLTLSINSICCLNLIQANIDKITSGQEESAEGSQEDSQDDSGHLGNMGTLGKKVYCTYWIRTGNCNYMQEGCKYKHEIPPDDETRLAIGVRTYPTWPREDPTPPPKPAKPWQAQKPALQQSWRRQESQGTHKGNSREKVSATPARSTTRPQSNPSASVPTTVSTNMMQNGFKAPAQNGKPGTAHFSSNDNHALQQQSGNTPNSFHGNGSYQAAPSAAESFNRQSAHIASHVPTNQSANVETYGLQSLPPNPPALNRSVPTMQASSGITHATTGPQGDTNLKPQRTISNTYAHTTNPSHFNGSVSYQPGQASDGQNHGQTNAPPYMPTFAKFGQNKNPGREFPATLSYDNHPYADSLSQDHANTYGTSAGVAHGNVATNTLGRNPISSDSRANTPATTNSNAMPAVNTTSNAGQNGSDTDNFDIRAGTPAGTFGNSDNVHGIGRFFFNSNGSATDAARARNPASVNGSVTSKSSARIQNPFSPVADSPRPIHRRLFCKPGEDEYVANPIEDVQSKPQRSAKRTTNGSVQGKGKLYGGKGVHAGKGHGHGPNPGQA